MRARLAALTPGEVRAATAAVCERLAALPSFTQAACVLTYVSWKQEIATHGLIQQLLACGRRVCVPQFDAARQAYGVVEIRSFAADLAPGAFGILEPVAAAVRLVDGDQINAALVPGLAFGRAGERLGRGRGFFDQLLSGIAGARIGLGHAFQVAADVPMHAHDQRLDFVVTDQELIDCRRGGA